MAVAAAHPSPFDVRELRIRRVARRTFYACTMTERMGEATGSPRPRQDGDIAYARSAGLLSRRVGDEMIVATSTGDAHLLTGTALTIWTLLAVPKTLPQLVEEIAAGYRAHPNAVGPDVQAFVSDLVSRGLAHEVVRRDD